VTRRSHRYVLWAAYIGIGGWVLLLVGFLWWTLAPATVTFVRQPVEILNDGNEVRIGEPIVLRLVVNKPEGVRVVKSDRFLECQSGNLVTLTATARDLPAGSYDVINDKTILPAKVAPGDVCLFVFRNTYQVNPIRTETVACASVPSVTALT
jgi:hypothetical protein